VKNRLSFGNSLKSLGVVQEALVLGLMIVSMFAIFYFDFDLTLKIGIAVLAFVIILLASIASQLLNIQKEAAKAQQ
jgi:predicted cation transporter